MVIHVSLGGFVLSDYEFSGQLLRMRRELLDVSMTELAFKMGVSYTTVMAWERGRYIPSSARLGTLAQVLDCTVSDFYMENERESV